MKKSTYGAIALAGAVILSSDAYSHTIKYSPDRIFKRQMTLLEENQGFKAYSGPGGRLQRSRELRTMVEEIKNSSNEERCRAEMKFEAMTKTNGNKTAADAMISSQGLEPFAECAPFAPAKKWYNLAALGAVFVGAGGLLIPALRRLRRIRSRKLAGSTFHEEVEILKQHAVDVISENAKTIVEWASTRGKPRDVDALVRKIREEYKTLQQHPSDAISQTAKTIISEAINSRSLKGIPKIIEEVQKLGDELGQHTEEVVRENRIAILEAFIRADCDLAAADKLSVGSTKKLHDLQNHPDPNVASNAKQIMAELFRCGNLDLPEVTIDGRTFDLTQEE